MSAVRSPGRLAATGGLLTAFSVLIMLAERLLPVGTLFVHLLLSLVMQAAIQLLGTGGAAAVWLATAVLAQLLAGPPVSLVFAFVSGSYPLLKSLLDSRVERRVPRFILKSAIAALLGALLYAAARFVGLVDPLLVLSRRWPGLPWSWIAVPALLAGFIVYDLLLDRALEPLVEFLRQIGLLG